MRWNRRGLLAAAVPFVAGCSGLPTASIRPDGGSPGAIINGNLVVPIDPETPLGADVRALVRSAGLTAVKLTLGGSGDESRAEALETIAAVDRAVGLNSETYMKIEGVADFVRCLATGQLGLIYSFEASEMLEADLDAIDQFRAGGVLVMGLSYNKTTPFASGVMSSSSTGLTDLGRQAVARMNASGVTLDLSHTDEPSSLSAIAASGKPVLITHAGCAAVHPHLRNKSDRLLRAMAEGGGVLGIYELSYLAASPRQPDLDDYLAHLTHALSVCGEDHVGIGSDANLTPFDTSPESLEGWAKIIETRRTSGVAAPGEGPPPFVIGLNRTDRVSVIADALRTRGYSARVVDKVLGSNFARVFADTWR